MATLNLSSNGAAITRSYQTVVESSLQGSSSPTYGQWAVFSVTAPLANAFQHDSGKESVLKVQSTGDGELSELIEEFSDGRVQFAFVKVKDPNTNLPKSVLIAWCGEGVPERTKGYFGSHLTAVARLLHGYHVQVTARSDRDLSPEAIVQKVADASGSKYSGGSSAPVTSSGPPPPVASKPVFTPTQVGGGGIGYNPLQSTSRRAPAQNTAVDEDGWGADAPPVTRTQLEKVQPAYQPTKVDMAQLTSQKPAPSPSFAKESSNEPIDVVRGAYQPIGKVDIAAIRRQAQESGSLQDDRPTAVRGAYEPVGKVDIAAIRSKAQPPSVASRPPPVSTSTDEAEEQPKSFAEGYAAYQDTGRITALPKPKVANRFGSSTSSFAGTKAPTPGGFDAKPLTSAAPVGVASRTFADEGGKTPAQIWAEKKARQSGAPIPSPSTAAPIASQGSGDGSGWKSGYTGKSWAPVETTKSGSSGEVAHQTTGGSAEADEAAPRSGGGVSALADRFASTNVAEGEDEHGSLAPPPMNLSSKPRPDGGVAIPGLPTPPPQPPRSATPPTPPAAPGSPIRIAQPVGRGNAELEAPEERFSPPPLPTESIARAVPPAHELEDEEPASHADPARAAGQAAAASAFGAAAASQAAGPQTGGKRAIAQYDYEKAEDNELELHEGEYVTNIDMVDTDWWMGENSKGETGLFPKDYVELVEDNAAEHAAAPVEQYHEEETLTSAAPPAPPAEPAAPAADGSPTATAQYDYDAAEDNELSFPDGAKILHVEFPDEDWWFGEYNGKTGLFPANYVQLDQ